MELVMLHNNEPATTSLAIAEGVGMPHASVIKLVRKYLPQLETFGSLGFEIRVMRPDGRGGQHGEVAYLNEPQSTLLITFMRNSEVVVQFKLRLVQAFFELRRQLTDAQSQANQMPLSVQHRADHIVAAGRAFNMLLKTGRAMGLAKPEAIIRANAAALEAAGVDIVRLMGAEDVVRPAIEHKAELGALTAQLGAWLEEQGGSEYTTEALMRGLGIMEPELGEYAQLAAAMQALGWKAVRLRAGGVQRRGYRKQGTPVRDELAERLAAWVAHQDGDFTLADAVRAAVDTDDATASRELQTRVGLILSRLGCAKMEKRGSSPRYWYRRAA